MKVYIGADHRGYDFKSRIAEILRGQGHEVIDLGSYNSDESCDYPRIADKVAREVAAKRNGRGVLVCMSGIGQAIAANKVPGAYAALCHNVESAELSRRHNNANILVLGAKFVNTEDLSKILETWIKTPFEGGRHRRRIHQIQKMEKGLGL